MGRYAFAGLLLLWSVPGRADTIITFATLISNDQQTIPSTYQPINAGYPGDGGPLGVTINWSNASSSNSTVSDATPAIDIPVSYSETGPGEKGEYQWMQETGFPGTPIKKLVISGDLNKQIDDMSVVAL